MLIGQVIDDQHVMLSHCHIFVFVLTEIVSLRMQETQISLSHQGKPSYWRSVLPYVSDARLHGDSLLCCHFQRTSEGAEFVCRHC